MKSYDELTLKRFSSIEDVFSKRLLVTHAINTMNEKEDQKKTIEDLTPKSLFIFSRTNCFRRILVKIVTNKYFELAITIFIILNSAILGINDYNSKNKRTWRNDLNDISEPVFTALFTLEFLMKVIAYGFIIGKYTYLRDAWNWIDFLVVLTSLLSTLPQFDNYSAFRTFRLLRPLRSLNSLQNMKILVSTLLSSLAQLGEIIVFALFIFLIFAIMGVSLWAGSIHYRCRETEKPVGGDWIAPNGSESWCGSLIEAHDKWHTVTVSNLYRDTQIEELNWGLVTFDNVIIAMLSIFQCITLEGWVDMMYYLSDTYFPVLTHLYFIVLVIIWSLFILNLTVAILLDNYSEKQNEEEGQLSSTLDLIEMGKDAKLPDEIIEFIISQDITITKKKKKVVLSNNDGDDANSSSNKSMASNFYHNLYVTFISSEVTVPDNSYYKYKITRFMYHFVMHPLFNTIIMMIIVMNTIMLAFDRYPEPPQSQQYIFYIFNIVFTIIFGLEVCCKMIALSFRGFVRDKFNIFDTLVVLSSVVELNLESGSGSSLGALRAVRLFRIFKIFRVGDLRVLMDSIGTTVMGMGNYTVLILLFIYLYNLLGMQFFAGKFSFGDDGLYDSNGIVPRENFDTIWEAFITIVIIMIGDGWNTIMYYGMLSSGNGFSLYFVTLYALGNVIMLNLFLAILLGNFDEARQFMAKQKAFEEFKRLHKKKTPLPIALTIVLGDLGDYIVSNIIGDKSITFIQDIEEANIPDQNEAPITKSQKIRNLNEEPVKINASNVFEDDKSPDNFIKSSGFTHREPNNLMNSFGQSHESMDRFFNESDCKKDYQTKHTAGNMIFQDYPVTNGRQKSMLPPINQKSEAFHEIPANQQEGEAYDQKLEDEDEENDDKDISNPEIAEMADISKIMKEDDQSKIEDNKFEYLDKRRSAKILRERDQESEPSDRFEDDQVEVKTGSLFSRICKYMNHSSLFIFHDSWRIRECILLLVISTENLTHKQPKMKKRNSLGGTSIKKQINEDDEQPQNEAEGEDEVQGDEVSENESVKTHTESSNSFDENLESSPYWSQVYHLNSLKIMNNKIITTKQNIKYSTWFEYFIITVIILNSLALILDNPLEDPNGPLSQTLKYLDIIFTIIFTIEATMKIIALGFFWNNMPGISGYILNGWNMLDFMIV